MKWAKRFFLSVALCSCALSFICTSNANAETHNNLDLYYGFRNNTGTSEQTKSVSAFDTVSAPAMTGGGNNFWWNTLYVYDQQSVLPVTAGTPVTVSIDILAEVSSLSSTITVYNREPSSSTYVCNSPYFAVAGVNGTWVNDSCEFHVVNEAGRYGNSAVVELKQKWTFTPSSTGTITALAVGCVNDASSGRLFALFGTSDLGATASLRGAGNSSTEGRTLKASLTYVSATEDNSGIIAGLENVDNTLKEQAEKEERQESELNQGQSDAEDSADDASSEASSTGTTLFAAFTSLLTALTNVTATNCVLPIPTITFSGGGSFNLGNLDLCTYDIPQGLATLGSLLLVFLIIPMGINCAKRMLSLYNELLGGK